MNLLFKLSSIPTLILSPVLAQSFEFSGDISVRAFHLLKNDEHFGANKVNFNFNSEKNLNEKIKLVNGLKVNYNDIEKKLVAKEDDSEIETTDILPGENYLSLELDKSQIVLGYQEIIWGDSFGLNYADIVNAKDERETFYNDYSTSKRTHLFLQYKYFFKDSSIQLLYSPLPEFNKKLPASLLNQPSLPLAIETKEEKHLKLFDENDYGMRLTTTLQGHDLSFNYLNYIDRSGHYEYGGIVNNKIRLYEKHDRISTLTFSHSKTIADEYVLRSDWMYTFDKTINTLDLNFDTKKSDQINLNIGLDTPSYHDFSFLIIYAQSSLRETIKDSLTPKDQRFGIFRITYDLKEERKIDVSYTNELGKKGHSIQSNLYLPFKNQVDFNLGSEHYWGSQKAMISQLNKVSNIFINLKHYF